jgi:hypothetical protein
MVPAEEATFMTKKGMQIFIASAVFIIFSASLAFGASVNLSRTGQEKCYNTSGTSVDCATAGAGQDGDIKAGVVWPASRFVSSGDCITDNLTGLKWTKDANVVGTKNWASAISSAAAVNLCGCDSWRLPNVNELESLVHAGYNEELCGGSLCSSLSDWLKEMGFSNVSGQDYWSSTTDSSAITFAWAVNMGGGIVNNSYAKITSLHVWPVCGSSTNVWKTGQTTSYATGDDGNLQKGVAWPATRFTVGTGAESDCVTDNLTGLMWTKDANRFLTKLWVNAITEANSQDLCGHDDWRLPNRKELFSLIDRSQHNPALLSGHPFDHVRTDNSYWSSTTQSSVTGSAWEVYMGSGVVSDIAKNNAFYVWPVRGGLSCANRSVKIEETGHDFDWIHSAYSEATTGQTILAQAVTLEEDLNFTGNKIISLIGGYNCGFTTNTGFTTINSLTIRGTGEVTISNLIIK